MSGAPERRPDEPGTVEDGAPAGDGDTARPSRSWII